MKTFFSLSAALLISAAALAQPKQNASVGLQAGYAGYNMRGQATESLGTAIDATNGLVTTSGRQGFYAGAFADVPLGENVSLRPAINYVQKGYSINGDLNIKGTQLGVNAKSQLQADYIEIPLLLKVNSGSLYAFAGPQVAYLAKANLRSTAGALGIALFNNNLDVKEQFNEWDMSVTGGVGYNLSKAIAIQALYHYGLSKVDAPKRCSAYNQGYKIGLTYQFQ